MTRVERRSSEDPGIAALAGDRLDARLLHTGTRTLPHRDTLRPRGGVDAAPDEEQARDAGRRRDDDGELSHRVPPADVDEGDVDDVAAATIDEVPLEWCFSNAVKLDFRHMANGYVATPGDVEAELKRIGHEIAPLDIVVVNTAAAAHYGQEDYIHPGCGIGREATLWLLERGVRVTGTDAWSWDAPFGLTAQRWLSDRDPSIIWEGHRASMEIGYCHMEKLANLDQLPDHGFLISCFPYKIKRASAGFTRAVAIIEEQ